MERIKNEYAIYKECHVHYVVIFTHLLESLSKYYMIKKPHFTSKKIVVVIILTQLSIFSHKIDNTNKQSCQRLKNHYKLKNMFLIERSYLFRWYIYPIITFIRAFYTFGSFKWNSLFFIRVK